MELYFLQRVTIIILHLHKTFEINLTHVSQENPKIIVGENSLFLKNHEAFWAEIN